MALSLHAVFEGLAVGLEEDVEGVWILFTAVCTHKFVMSFCMGVELVLSQNYPNYNPNICVELDLCALGICWNSFRPLHDLYLHLCLHVPRWDRNWADPQ